MADFQLTYGDGNITKMATGAIACNMFAYCGNSPVCFTNPSGQLSFRWLYDLWNSAEDEIWKLGAKVLDRNGYHLTADLLRLSASGSGNTYYADETSAISKKIASDSGFVASVMDNYQSATANSHSDVYYYEFPVSQGDLGAALHYVSYTYSPKLDEYSGGKFLSVTVI